MTVVLSHKSALKALLADRSVANDARHCMPADSRATCKELLTAQSRFNLGGKTLDVLMSGRDRRSFDPGLVQLHSPASLEGIPAFIKIDNTYIASPELCFVQIASSLSVIDAILFGYYLCGDYRPTSIRQKTGNQPLTSVDRLGQFIDLLPHMRGKRRAQRALWYVVDNSNSPQESRLTIVIILPTRLGGFGLMRPKLNQPIPGTMKIGDLCWLEQGLILEYDSQENHAGNNQLNADSIRRAKIELADFHVISVTPQQLKSLQCLNELGELTARNLGADFRHRSSSFAQKQRALHHALFLEQKKL